MDGTAVDARSHARLPRCANGHHGRADGHRETEAATLNWRGGVKRSAMLDAGVGDGIEIRAALVKAGGTMVPPRAAHDQVPAAERNRGTELGTALKDRGMECAGVAPALATMTEDMDGTSGMQALDGFARGTNGEQVTMNGDCAAEVSMRIQGGVLNRRFARPTLVVQSRCLDDRRRDTKILVMPRADEEPLPVHGHGATQLGRIRAWHEFLVHAPGGWSRRRRGQCSEQPQGGPSMRHAHVG